MPPDSSAIGLLAHRAAARALARFSNVPAEVREELVQDATLKTLCAKDVREANRYAAKVARGLAIDWLRRPGEQALADPSVVHEEVPWHRRVDARLALAEVGAALDAAPGLHRDTLTVLFVEDTTIEEAVERRRGADPTADLGRERDLWYKRRRRAIAWIRSALAEAA